MSENDQVLKLLSKIDWRIRGNEIELLGTPKELNIGITSKSRRGYETDRIISVKIKITKQE